MEIHHHPDVHHKRKKFKEYFFEFIMIFLAVTLGFFAEGLREHIGDRTREKEYMTSLLQELKYDTSQYNKVLHTVGRLQPQLDSLYKNLKNAARYNYIIQGKWNYLMNQTSIEYRPGLPTIRQLLSSGNLRLIESRLVGNKILEYEAYVKGNVERLDDNINTATQKVYGFEDALCDYKYFVTVDLSQKADSSTYDMPLVVKDTIRLNEFANSFVNYKAISTAYNKTVLDALKYATELIKLINNEYHLEKE
ncbi:MAG TPA: hypothetical protein VK787_05670 [Puia sp.]|jgi:hypothetical protein|nr:hypothetical protein [Puia sp.]